MSLESRAERAQAQRLGAAKPGGPRGLGAADASVAVPRRRGYRRR